ncbi:CRISPR-associated endonuclease Cas2 [Acinetobacter towneri]|uniref:CRISPR-associated endonuclease Cas2 n=1 Tax=Acinetobacter towneri TaxID=202956 RepID=UPI0030B9B6FF|nr:CRISPR-associated endonuclease Cas2 [Acinetobacter towneri]
MRNYLGMYDVSCPRHRSTLFRLLSAYGIHQQKSVFECVLNTDFRKQMIMQMQSLPNDQPQRIILIQIYPNHQDTVYLGAAKRLPASNCLYIA